MTAVPNAATPAATQLEWVKCDCGRMMRRVNLAKHRARCKAAKKPSHCKHCAPASVSDVTDRLRRGMLVDAVAAELGRTVDDVYRVRKKARDVGCLPRPTEDEADADRHALALARLGMRTCTECRGEFVQRLKSPDQEACGNTCRDERKSRLKREARAKNPGYRPYEVTADSTPEAQEAQVRVVREKEARITAAYVKTGQELEAKRADSYKVWWECLGVAL